MAGGNYGDRKPVKPMGANGRGLPISNLRKSLGSPAGKPAKGKAPTGGYERKPGIFETNYSLKASTQYQGPRQTANLTKPKKKPK